MTETNRIEYKRELTEIYLSGAYRYNCFKFAYNI